MDGWMYILLEWRVWGWKDGNRTKHEHQGTTRRNAQVRQSRRTESSGESTSRLDRSLSMNTIVKIRKKKGWHWNNDQGRIGDEEREREEREQSEEKEDMTTSRNIEM